MAAGRSGDRRQADRRPAPQRRAARPHPRRPARSVAARRRGLPARAADVRSPVDRAVAERGRSAVAQRNVRSPSISRRFAVRADPKALDHILVRSTTASSTGGPTARCGSRQRRLAMRPDRRARRRPRHRRQAPRRARAVLPRDPPVARGRRTGLGLSIVKHLVESMDGEVGVEPNLPRAAYSATLARASHGTPT
jgi:hypothetical protein